MKLQSIQALRGIAALLVAIYHVHMLEAAAIVRNGGSEAPLAGGLFENGFAGVDLFFVISGFIMVWVTHALPARPAASADFLFARVTRIYPLWWAAALTMTLFIIVTGHQGLVAAAGEGTQTEGLAPGYVIASLLLIPQADFPVLSVGWTLIHEMYFYIIFALLLLVRRSLLPFALTLWGLVVVAGSFAGLAHHEADGFIPLAVHPLTMEFIFGAAVGLMVTSGIAWRAGLIAVAAALWFTAALGLQGPADAHALMWGRVVGFGLPAAALIYGLAVLDVNERLAWLIPAATGALISATIFQLFGIDPASPQALRLAAVTLATIVGAISALIVLWIGWLGGIARPVETRRAGRALQPLFAKIARTGDWSYSIYLGHLFALGICFRAFGWLSERGIAPALFRLGAPGPLDNLAFLACCLAATLVAGWAGYRMIERPSLILFGRLRERLFYRRRAVTALL